VPGRTVNVAGASWMVVVGAAVVAGVVSTIAVALEPALSPELEQPAISAVATST